MLTLAAYLHDISPFLVEFSPGFGLRWYGLSYAMGFAVAYLIFRFLCKRGYTTIPEQKLIDGLLLLIATVIVGGRLGYVLIYDRAILTQFDAAFPYWGVLRLSQGGMAYHGALVGVALGVWYIAKKNKVSAWHVADVASLGASIGLGLGRVANFINGELLGKIVAAPGEPAPWWSVKFPQELVSGHEPPLTDAQQQQLGDLIARVAKPNDDGYLATSRLIDAVQHGAPSIRGPIKQALEPLLSARHPSQLYQAFFEGVVLTVVLWIIARKPHLTGMVAAAFLGVYGVLRVIAEFFRLPDAQFGAAARIAGLSRGQWLSVLMVAVGVAAFVYLRKVRSPINPGWATK
ncbi:prolipoprotein diacylglyceryl transferase [Phycisphaerae bacterium]|jgi:phosphatidylglycerol:prolipoprotein diacylglycerol transferase|nr:prolipoprotein diacylglyceryl transferase [Phycisphaerae bacterium]